LSNNPTNLSERFSRFLAAHSSGVILAVVALTLLLIAPMVSFASDENASTEPGGEVFDLRDEIDDKLSSTTFVTGYIAEAHPGADGHRDILTQAALWELFRNEARLREADRLGQLTPGELEAQPFLRQSFDRDTNLRFTGTTSIADAVQFALLLGGTSLELATDDEVKLAVAHLMASPRTAALADQLSVLATNERRTLLGEEIDYWVSPALIMGVLADNAALGGGSNSGGLATDEAGLDKEQFARAVQSTLRGDEEHYELWGLAIDQTLAAQDQGKTAGVFIALTIIAALAVVGLSFRAYWPTALTAVGVGTLMIWLKGISALVGIKGGLVVDLIVPIAMVSLGVDFAVHAARRYYEERGVGMPPISAYRVGMAGVSGALLLAMLSDGIAFLSNVPSGIEAVVHFGIAAGISVGSSFIVLGVLLPLALMRIDSLAATRRPIAARHLAVLAGSTGVAMMVGGGVITLVAVSQAVGAAIIVIAALSFIGIPLALLVSRGAAQTPEAGGNVPQASSGESRAASLVVGLVTGLAARRAIVLPAALVVTALSTFLALRLEATFDVKDFFSNDSDLVIGLDKLDEHLADRTGEGGVVFLEGELTDLSAILAMEEFIESLADNPYVGHNADGSPSLFELHLPTILRLITASPLARERLQEATGVEITDADADGLPDSQEQNAAALGFASTQGVPLDATTNVYTADQVNTAVYYNPERPDRIIATLFVGIPGTREQSAIVEAKVALLDDMAPLQAHPAMTRVGLTGSPFVREAELTATVSSLRTSLPIAAVGAFLLLLLAMRSLRYAIVTVVPIGLVVAWLYAIMELAGFALNFVSATIGAVSIGVGIDYSIHMTERFREELARSATRMDALARSAHGTGVSLLASAGSSVIGFSIMGFAPMPMFSTYGILTAVMIFLALTASLVVLPSLLMLITPELTLSETSKGEA
jgi:predicted RND superfamily exporter protein